MTSDIEHEGKILNIDVEKVRATLRAVGATKKADYDFKRYVFDVIPATENRWVRLRSDGTSTTLTVKEIQTDNIDGTLEWETEVADLSKTFTILEKIGISPRGYQENTREEYTLESVSVSIDCWPKLQPYLEIEAENVEQIYEVVERLGYRKSDLTGVNTDKLYKDIDIDLKKVDVLAFDKE